VQLARQHGRVTVRDVVRITGANRATVRLHIQQLLTADRLVLRGRGRGAWYERVLREEG